MAKRKIIVRDLALLGARIFFVWGALVLAKGLWDCFGGQPEANYYSPEPWQFVTRDQWLRYAGFEVAYGAACLAVAWVIKFYSRRLPETTERDFPEESLV
jgi:hypothetical protein